MDDALLSGADFERLPGLVEKAMQLECALKCFTPSSGYRKETKLQLPMALLEGAGANSWHFLGIPLAAQTPCGVLRVGEGTPRGTQGAGDVLPPHWYRAVTNAITGAGPG